MALPSGYKKLEYIEGTGTQYIDTGVSAPSGVAIFCEVTLIGYIDTLNSIFGAVDAEPPYYRDYFAAHKDNGAWELGAYGYSHFGIPTLGEKLRIDCCTISGAISCTINGVSQSVDTTIGGNGARSSLPIYLFAMNFSGGLNAAKMKLYNFKIYLDSSKENLVRDFVPCKNTSGIVGLWDNVGGKFYQNAGSGAFVSGPEIYEGGIFVKVNGVWKQIDNVTVNAR